MELWFACLSLRHPRVPLAPLAFRPHCKGHGCHVRRTCSAKTPASVSPSAVCVWGRMQGGRERSAWPISRVLSSQTAHESAALAPAGEATYGQGISRGGNPSESPPRAHPPSPSWKEKKPNADVRKSRLSRQRPGTWKSAAPPLWGTFCEGTWPIVPRDPSHGPVRWASLSFHFIDEETEVLKGDVTNQMPCS